MLIFILILHTILGQLTINKTTESYNILTKKTAPDVVKLLCDFRMESRELFLLVSNRVVDKKNRENLNRIRQITDVNLPYYISNLTLLKQSLIVSDSRNIIIDSIVKNSSKYIELVKELNTVLLTPKDYNDTVKMEKINDIKNTKILMYSTEIDNRLSFLQIEFNKEFRNSFNNLSGVLKNNSRFILWANLLFICLGLIITYKNIRDIIKPIKELLSSVKKIKDGDYNNKISLNKIYEFSTLGNSFNNMSNILQKKFNEVELKNQELEQFVYIASHDLQEPLRTVNSFSDMLIKGYSAKLDTTAMTYIQFISQASTRMSLLVRNLLDYSCLGKNRELTLVNCNEMLKSLEIDLSVLINNNNAKINAENLPEILAYKTELRLLFQNLINNAIKFHKPGIPPIVKIKAKEHIHFWEFIISDNGIGIPKDKKDKIFGMFQKLNDKSQFEGTGIGLAHCAKIIEMHKGTIKVDSELNNGSTFSITIAKNLKK